jgi:hypothetical protein
VYISTVGAGPVAGQNWAGLYSAAGTLLTSVGIDSMIPGVVGINPATFTTPVVCTTSMGFVWRAVLFNAATPPTLVRTGGISQGANNAGLLASQYKYATAGTGATTLPASITPGSLLVGPSYWAANSA